MPFFKRDKKIEVDRLRQARHEAVDYQQVAEPPARKKGPMSPEQRRGLVEQRIQQAMAEGAFDNLPGRGKPLPLAKNPYLDEGQALAFNLLQDNGLAPEWIERDKAIRRKLADLRSRLAAAWQARPAAEAGWQRSLAGFEAEVNRLNRKIDDLNLLVPAVQLQRPRLRLADELRRLEAAADE